MRENWWWATTVTTGPDKSKGKAGELENDMWADADPLSLALTSPEIRAAPVPGTPKGGRNDPNSLSSPITPPDDVQRSNWERDGGAAPQSSAAKAAVGQIVGKAAAKGGTIAAAATAVMGAEANEFPVRSDFMYHVGVDVSYSTMVTCAIVAAFFLGLASGILLQWLYTRSERKKLPGREREAPIPVAANAAPRYFPQLPYPERVPDPDEIFRALHVYTSPYGDCVHLEEACIKARMYDKGGARIKKMRFCKVCAKDVSRGDYLERWNKLLAEEEMDARLGHDIDDDRGESE
jgi:hypothetical protein